MSSQNKMKSVTSVLFYGSSIYFKVEGEDEEQGPYPFPQPLTVMESYVTFNHAFFRPKDMVLHEHAVITWRLRAEDRAFYASFIACGNIIGEELYAFDVPLSDLPLVISFSRKMEQLREVYFRKSTMTMELERRTEQEYLHDRIVDGLPPVTLTFTDQDVI
jgi:hypothetical protein